MKSLLVSVFWPCWEWGPRLRPDLRYINSSYASHLSIRDNVKSRTLIQSGWFQSRWGSVFKRQEPDLDSVGVVPVAVGFGLQTRPPRRRAGCAWRRFCHRARPIRLTAAERLLARQAGHRCLALAFGFGAALRLLRQRGVHGVVHIERGQARPTTRLSSSYDYPDASIHHR